MTDLNGNSGHWTARFSRPIIFVILTLIGMGVYLAFTIPIAVFPSTDFPRIVVGIDNGVAPINQMQVTITRPIEEAMNAVPGLEQVRSITSRGSSMRKAPPTPGPSRKPKISTAPRLNWRKNSAFPLHTKPTACATSATLASP